MEHILQVPATVSRSNKSQILYLNSVCHPAHNYLAKNDTISCDQIINSYKYVDHSIKNQEVSLRALQFNDDCLSFNNYSNDSNCQFNHVAITAKFLSNERFVRKQVMKDYIVNKHEFNNNFNYNDDNFLHLASSNITNYSPSGDDSKFKNSNLYNPERTRYIMWRKWSQKSLNLPLASVGTTKEVLKPVSNDLYHQLVRSKCNQTDHHNQRFIVFTFPDQHHTCFGPLVNSADLTKFNINQQIKYSYSLSKDEVLNIIDVEGSDVLTATTSYDDSICSSMNSAFTAASNSSSVQTSIIELSNNKSSASLYLKSRKSSLKSRSLSINESTTLQSAISILLSYNEDLSKIHVLHSALPREAKQVMFNTGVEIAKCLPELDSERYSDALDKCRQLEAQYHKSTQILNEKWQKTLERHEERSVQLSYWHEMDLYSDDQYRQMMVQLDSELSKQKQSTNSQCTKYKKLHSRNRRELNALKSGHKVLQCPKMGALIHGHFVDDLEEKRLERLLNWEDVRAKYNPRLEKSSVLRNIIADDDFEIYYRGLYECYGFDNEESY